MGSQITKAIVTEQHKDKAFVAAATAGIIYALRHRSTSHSSMTNAILIESSAQLMLQFWVSFVSAPIMRHHFDREGLIGIQTKLFPKYGLVLASASAISLAAFHFGNPGADWSKWLPIVLASNAFANGINLVWLFPKMNEYLLKDVAEKDEVKKERWHKKFRMLHGLSVVATLASMGFNALVCASRL